MLRIQNGPSYISSAARYPEKLSRAQSWYSYSRTSSPFFSRSLYPVLDSSKRDIYPMVSPQMPGGTAKR
jgi:hypothetical protein